MSGHTSWETFRAARRQRSLDPERLSVWCGADRHDICAKRPCPCGCHVTLSDGGSPDERAR